MATGTTISRAADQAGVGVETIRFYERCGLIEQPMRRRGGGYRLYSDEIVERIRFIRQAQDLGFTLRQIAELLSLRADPGADCGDVRARAVSKREEVDHKIAQLRNIRSALDALIASCPGGGALRACTIIDAMAGRQAEKVFQPSGKADRHNRETRGRNMKTAILEIDGMHCDGCARTIEALLSIEPGVRKATVSFKTQEARILFDPRVAKDDQLAAAIQKAGYSAASQSP